MTLGGRVQWLRKHLSDGPGHEVGFDLDARLNLPE
jgi:hypothetical protein